MSKKKKTPKKAKRGTSGASPGLDLGQGPNPAQERSEAQRLFEAGDYFAARAACGEGDGDLKARLSVDVLFIYIYAGGLALIGVLGALTMR